MERRGPLWTDRFKHTILESGRAVWGCWIYIENNAVRAGMVSQASDYRFGSHGVWQQSGRHPFAANIEVVALPMLQKCFGISGLGALRAAMQEALGGKEEQDLSEDECVLQVQRRVRYWTQGLVIGSKLFVTNVMSRHRPVENLKRHRSARLVAPDGTEMYAWNRLRVLVGT